MVAIQNILLVLGTATAAVIPRDAATVLTDLKKVDADTKSLTSAVTSWNGQTLSAITIQNDESTVESDIKTTTTDANAVSSVSDADASSIISYITGTLTPDITAALNALVAKKAAFSSAGLTSVVTGDLSTLKSDTDSLGSVLVAKAPADQTTAAKAALSSIDAAFASASAAFA